MYYNEFREASKKHLISCQCLIVNLETCKQNEQTLLSTIYYLTGYVFETIFKYSIYSSIGFDKKKDIAELKSNGLSFADDIKIHSLTKLKRTLEEKQIASLQGYEDNKKLFNAWNSEVRYSKNTDFTKDEIISFFNFSTNIFTALQRYR